MGSNRSHLVAPTLRSWGAAAAIVLAASLAAQSAPWTPVVGVDIKESYDDNVLLQDYGDQARRKSWVTVIAPSAGVTYQNSPAFKALVSYAAEAAGYHGEPSENYVAQRLNINLSGQSGQTTWEMLNGVVLTDGNKFGPSFTGGGGVPALGGIPMRDRRDALVVRNGLKLTQTFGKAFLRPLFNSYVHEFRTLQFTAAARTGYENYVDRREFSGGFDTGYEVFAKTRLFGGYRLGRQEQSPLNGAWSPYSSTYHRALLGAEGSPAGWVKFSFLGGPDFRNFSRGTPTFFERRKTLYYYDASITLTPSPQDSVSLAARRFAQPAFSSHSVYEDVVYDFGYRRKLGGKLTAAAGYKIYSGLWLQPTARRDTIYTAAASVGYAIGKGLNADLSYARDWVRSAVADTGNREYKRHLVAAGIKYSL